MEREEWFQTKANLSVTPLSCGIQVVQPHGMSFEPNNESCITRWFRLETNSTCSNIDTDFSHILTEGHVNHRRGISPDCNPNSNSTSKS